MSLTKDNIKEIVVQLLIKGDYQTIGRVSLASKLLNQIVKEERDRFRDKIKLKASYYKRVTDEIKRIEVSVIEKITMKDPSFLPRNELEVAIIEKNYNHHISRETVKQIMTAWPVMDYSFVFSSHH